MLSRDFPYRLGGPVLAWELTRVNRQRWLQMLAVAFILFCALQFAVSYARFSRHRAEVARNNTATEALTPVQLLDMENNARLLFATQAIPTFFKIQLFWLLCITPAITAGALGHEKERDTLTALFGTQLSDREIVAGKALGRIAILWTFLLYGLPVPALLAGFAMLDIGPILLCYLQAAILVVAMAGLCILCSIITKRTRDAIMACYSSMVVITLVILALMGDDPLPTWMNPVEIVVRIASPPFYAISAGMFLVHLGSFLLVGLASLWLSRRLLRWASLRQLEARPRFNVLRRGLGRDPIRWREGSILGIAPAQTLRTIPSWLGWAGAFVCSLMFVLATINMQAHGQLWYHFSRGQWSELLGRFQRLRYDSIPNETIVMGVILCFLSGFTVLIRSTGAVSEEQRRKTWDDLLMTGIPVRDLLESKRKGILDAAWPYVILYAIPIFGYGLCGGVQGFMAAFFTFLATLIVVYAAAFIGTRISTSSPKPIPRIDPTHLL